MPREEEKLVENVSDVRSKARKPCTGQEDVGGTAPAREGIERHYIVFSHKGPITAKEVALQDLVTRRCDLIARCILDGIMTSFGTRRDTKVTIHLKRGPASVTFDGDQVRHLRSHTLSAAQILKEALRIGDITEERREELYAKQPKTKQTKGVRMNVESTLDMLHRVVQQYEPGGSKFVEGGSVLVVELLEDGERALRFFTRHAASSSSSGGGGAQEKQGGLLERVSLVLVLLGDNMDISDEDRGEIKGWAEDSKAVIGGLTSLSLSNVSLQSGQCVQLFHHYLDLLKEGELKN